MEAKTESIPSLPTEIIIQILQILDYRTLLTCTQVCSDMKAVVDSTASLQYTIELAIRGQVDGSHESTMSTVDRVRQLNEHTSAWKTLKWSREIRIQKEYGGLWELFGGVFAQSTPGQNLVFWQLPSDLRGIPERRWLLSRDCFDFTIRDFAIDPHQDLLVLIEEGGFGYRVHLRTLSAGKPHPLANEKALLCLPEPEDEDEESGSYNIQIFGGLIGILCILIDTPENFVAVWDWRMGELLLDAADEDIEGFTLLSNNYIAFVVSYNYYALVVVDFRIAPTGQHNLRDYSAHYFKYPLLDDNDMQHIELRADPGNLCKIDNNDVPFYHYDVNFLLVLNIGYVTKCHHHMETVRHFIPSRYLISLLETGRKIFDVDWISNNTRMLITPDRSIENIWVCYVYGTRFVTYEGNGTRAMIRVYDFNQPAVRKDAQEPAQHEAPGSIESSPTIISDRPDLFSEEVETSLPYWTNVASLETEGFCKLMCSEDSIIIPGRLEYRVLVF